MSDVDEIANMKLPDNNGKKPVVDKPGDVRLEKDGGFLKWFVKHFVAMKPKDVLDRVMNEVFDPQIKMLASNMFDAAKNFFLFGDGSDDDGPSLPRKHVPYGDISTGKQQSPSVIGPTKEEKAAGKFTNVSFKELNEAIKLKAAIREYFKTYPDGFLSVSQFYDFAHLAQNSLAYPEEDWGWSGKGFPEDLKVVPTWNNRWSVAMPPVQYLQGK